MIDRSSLRMPTLPSLDRRRGVLVVVAVISVLSAIVGWTAGQRIKSPAEAAAETEAPEASLITVPVELRELSQLVVVRGTVRASDATAVTVATSDGAATVVTGLPKEAGAVIEEGDVMAEVSSRPVLALQGPLPMFRNLIPGLEGPDVTQLEEALLRLGHDPGPVDGTFDAATSTAVEALYTDAGYPAPEPAEADQEGAAAARELVTTQQQAVTDAKAALSAAGGEVPQSQRLQLDQAVTSAENNLSSVTVTAQQAKEAADAELTAAEGGHVAAQADAATAADRLEQAQGGTHPDTGGTPTEDELAELQAEKDAAAAAVDETYAYQEAARAARANTYRDQDALLEEADSGLAIAKATRTETLEPASTASLRSAVDAAEDQLDAAQADLAEAEGKLGAWFPTSELVFLSSTPREVQAVNVEVGDTPEGAVMTVTGAETMVESGLSSADRRLVEIGAEALLEDDNLGISVPAVVTSVADNPGGGELSADRYGMVLEPTEELPDDALNVNLRISIPISSSGGEVLAVPFAALSAGPDGTARVEVEREGGRTEVVEVSTGLRAEGYVQVQALDGGVLEEGHRVVVGQDMELPTGDEDGDATSDDGESDDEPVDESDSGSDDSESDGGSGDAESGEAEADDAESGDAESGDAESDDAESGDAESGDAES